MKKFLTMLALALSLSINLFSQSVNSKGNISIGITSDEFYVIEKEYKKISNVNNDTASTREYLNKTARLMATRDQIANTIIWIHFTWISRI